MKMNPYNISNTYSYRIDKDNIITYVCENWFSFAEENDGGGKCHPDFVKGKSIMQFIADHETIHILESIIRKARNSKQLIKRIPFRCDSPSKRRFMELSLIPLGHDDIEFRSTILNIEEREAIAVLQSNVPTSEEFIRICSYCKKMAVSENKWVDLEIAVSSLKLFEKSTLPQISHSVCPSCYRTQLEL